MDYDEKFISFPAFSKLARAVRLRDVSRVPQATWDAEPYGFRITDAMTKFLDQRQQKLNFEKPILLRTALHSTQGVPLMGQHFPYGAWLPDRTAHETASVNAGGECYFELSEVDEQFAESGSSPSVVEFSSNSIVNGDMSLLSLLQHEEINLGSSQGLLIIADAGDFRVLTFEDILHGAEVKACWLTLVLDFERVVLSALKSVGLRALQQLNGTRLAATHKRAITRDAIAKNKQQAFRLEKVAKAAVQRYVNATDTANWFVFDMLENTMLCDKKVMVRKLFGRFDMGKEFDAAFERAEHLRNWCAHPSSVAELDLNSLDDMRSLLRLIELLVARILVL